MEPVDGVDAIDGTEFMRQDNQLVANLNLCQWLSRH